MELAARNEKVKEMILQRLMSGSDVFLCLPQACCEMQGEKMELAARNEKVKEMILQRLMSGKLTGLLCLPQACCEMQGGEDELAARNEKVKEMILQRLMSGNRRLYAFHKHAVECKVEKMSWPHETKKSRR